MDRNNLVRTIEQVQNDIRQYKAKLVNSEYLTRKILIDPVLEALDYSIMGTNVAVEYIYAEQNRADYALWSGPAEGKPACLAEARKLGDKMEPVLVSGADPRRLEKQRYFTYYIALTDGGAWQIYETSPGRIEENLCIELRLYRQSASYCADGLERLVDLLRAPKVDEGPGLGWVALTDFTDTMAYESKPSSIRFPDGEESLTKSWYHLVEHTARWLWENELLTVQNSPIMVVSEGTAHLVSTDASHASDSFWVPLGKGELFVSKQGGKAAGPQSAWERAKTLLKACDVDPRDVFLQAPQR